MARQPVVRHNDWGSLAPATLGDWEPTLSVTVVVPTFNYQHTLPYVLAGLAAQSAHLGPASRSRARLLHVALAVAG